MERDIMKQLVEWKDFVGLQRDFEELQEYYEADDWFHFDIFFEAVEATIKAYYLVGKISREDLNCIFRKYGIL